jgi:2-(1,2-epoxy-1,2-dihydrophenyl)acetyl-CoA isomerase
MFHSDLVLVARQDTVATLTLNRPDRLNALDLPTMDALLRQVAAAARDPLVRALVITGAGRAFSAGGDLRATLAANPKRPGDAFLDLAGLFHQSVIEIRRMPKPVFAAINGAAAGGGFSLALACDFRVMAESAFLQQAYTTSGLCIDGGGTFTLPRLVGLGKALELALLDERVPAREALESGLVHRVVPDAELLQRTADLAAHAASRAVGAFGRVKQLMNASFGSSLEAQLEEERRQLAAAANSDEGHEGLAAFVAKRPPDYLASRRGQADPAPD